MKTVDVIPQNVQEFAKEFTALASKHNLTKGYITLSFSPWDNNGNNIEWDAPINISWDSGRHGADAKKYKISTTLYIQGEVNDG